MTLLGTISPFAIRLSISDAQTAGRVSGRIYAISTLGSFVGTFLPVLLFIPLVGTTYTFLGFSLYLLLVALVGMGLSTGWKTALRWAWMPLVILAWRAAGRAVPSRQRRDRSTKANRLTTTSRCWSRTATATCA